MIDIETREDKEKYIKENIYKLDKIEMIHYYGYVEEDIEDLKDFLNQFNRKYKLEIDSHDYHTIIKIDLF